MTARKAAGGQFTTVLNDESSSDHGAIDPTRISETFRYLLGAKAGDNLAVL